MNSRWFLLLHAVASSSPSKRNLVFDLHAVQRAPASGKLEENFQHSEFATKARSLRQRKRETHPVQIANYANVEYHIVVEVGTPCATPANTQIFRVVPDTGSADLWIPAQNCSACSTERLFDSSKSCTADWLGYRTHFKYGDGTRASGLAFSDVVKVGDIFIENQTVVQVDEMSNSVGMLNADGVLGLAHYFSKSRRHHISEATFMERLFQEHDMPRMFSFRLTDQDRTSMLIFGDPEVETYAKEPLIYGKQHFMESSALWLTSVYSIGFAHTGIERQFTSPDVVGAPVLVDSGTSLILLTPEIWDSLMPQLATFLRNCELFYNDGSVMQCDCPATGLLHVPNLVINLIDEAGNERPLCMAPGEYISHTIDPISNLSSCAPSIQRGSDKQPFPLIFGMTFMRAFYTNFDIERRRIGFARSKLSPLPAYATCTVHTKFEKKVWMLIATILSLVVFFAFYTCFCGDYRACCGMPSLKMTDPCIECNNESHYKPLCVLNRTNSDIETDQVFASKVMEEETVTKPHDFYKICTETIITDKVDVSSRPVGTMGVGTLVKVLEVQDLGYAMRARIENPAGWISISQRRP